MELKILTPRPYQVAAGKSFVNLLNDGKRRGVIVLPTGTGKTITALMLAKMMGPPVLWLAHRDELIQQPYKAVASIWPDASIGIVKAQMDQWRRDIVFASIQTAFRERRLETLSRREWRLVIVDECHHAPSASWRKVVEGVGCLSQDTPVPVLGLTATPERLDSARLDDIFERVVYQYHLGQAIKDGYLVPPDVIFEQMKISLDGVHSRGGDFNPQELDIALLEGGIVESVRRAVAEHAHDRKTLIFTVSVKQAQLVADALKDHGLPAASIDGTMHVDERRYILRKFAKGQIRYLANCAILTEGFDEPTIDCIVMARPTQSKSLFIQCCGRGLRLAPGKKDCRIIDMVALSSRHSLVQAPVLFGAEVEEEIREKRQEALFKVDPVEYWRQRLSTQLMGLESISRSDMQWIKGNSGELLLGVGSFGTVRLRPIDDLWEISVLNRQDLALGMIEKLAEEPVELELAQGIGEDYVRRCKAVTLARGGKWRDQPATEAQLEALRRWKITPPEGLTKGQASQMLTAAAARTYEPATEKQVSYLRSLGIEFDENITKREAGRLIGAARS